jgi:methionine-rich copper-binding protein CopC
VQIHVENQGPSVELVTPDDGSTHFADQHVSFRATVYDVDGEYFGNFCPSPDFHACVEWRSNIDGVLTSSNPSENALNFSSALSKGTHTITVTAQDQFGAAATQSVTVTVEAARGQPTARILTPLDEFTWRETTLLRGTASDPEDQSLPPTSLEWYSSVDGFLGTGATLQVDLTGPRCEDELEHVITFRVTDSDGHVSTDQVRVRFHNVC